MTDEVFKPGDVVRAKCDDITSPNVYIKQGELAVVVFGADEHGVVFVNVPSENGRSGEPMASVLEKVPVLYSGPLDEPVTKEYFMANIEYKDGLGMVHDMLKSVAVGYSDARFIELLNRQLEVKDNKLSLQDINAIALDMFAHGMDMGALWQQLGGVCRVGNDLRQWEEGEWPSLMDGPHTDCRSISQGDAPVFIDEEMDVDDLVGAIGVLQGAVAISKMGGLKGEVEDG